LASDIAGDDSVPNRGANHRARGGWGRGSVQTDVAGPATDGGQ